MYTGKNLVLPVTPKDVLKTQLTDSIMIFKIRRELCIASGLDPRMKNSGCASAPVAGRGRGRNGIDICHGTGWAHIT